MDAVLTGRPGQGVMAAWTEQAACTGRPDLMDPPQHTAWTLGAAMALCHHCPVLEQCRQWALSIPGHADPGFVAGGLTEEERQRMRRSRSTPGDKDRRLTEYGRLRAAGLNQRQAAIRVGIHPETARKYDREIAQRAQESA